MLEGYTRYRKLIGRGVAVMCPDGLVRKYKIIGVRMHYGVSGERIEGVELDMPSFMANQFFVDGIGVVKDGCHLWLSTSHLYRNKGECARANARERIGHVERKIVCAMAELERIGRERDDKTLELLQLEKSRGDLTSSYEKKKWFLEKI